MTGLQAIAEYWVKGEMTAYLNILGLFLDIIGVILLYKFGLPTDIKRGGITHIIAGGANQNEAKKADIYDRWARIGLHLLIFGFLLQMLGNIAFLAKS